MRIHYLLPAPGIPVQGPSGASAHVRGLCAALGQAHDLRIVAARLADERGSFGGPPLQGSEVGVPGWPSWLDDWRELREVRAARRVAREVLRQSRAGWTPELLVERHSLFSDAGWRLHDELDIPWILEVNAPALLERERFERLRQPDMARRWEREVLRAAPRIACVSHWLRRWLVEELGCSQVVRVPNGVEARVGDRDRGRAWLGIVDDQPLLGFVGSMKPWHGVGRLPALARRLGARLVLAGEAREPATFLAEREALPEDTIRTGHLGPQDLADVVAALDLGLVPYGADAPPWFCPLKVLDYRAQGTPVIGTDVGDTADLVGDAGAIVPPGDPEALLAAARSWLGRRCPPMVRSWGQVGAELLAAAGVGAAGVGAAGVGAAGMPPSSGAEAG